YLARPLSILIRLCSPLSFSAVMTAVVSLPRPASECVSVCVCVSVSAPLSTVGLLCLSLGSAKGSASLIRLWICVCARACVCVCVRACVCVCVRVCVCV